MERNFDNFDQFAKDYRSIHNQNIQVTGADSDYFAEYKIDIVHQLTAQKKDLKILDLGCGDGISGVFFQKYFPESYYTGIDISEESLAEGRARALPNATFTPYNGTEIPMESNSFDVCFIACVLHHIEHKLHQTIINEVYRVLKPGGKLYIFEHNPHNPLTMKAINTCPFDEDAVLLTPAYSKKLFKTTYFGACTIDFTLFVPRHKLFKPLLGIEPLLKWLPIGGQYYITAAK